MFFEQVREPGRLMELDWTDAAELKITIAGAPYDHKYCHSVLPYSNGEWAIPCQSESASSLIAGSQAAYWEFGGVCDSRPTGVRPPRTSCAPAEGTRL